MPKPASLPTLTIGQRLARMARLQPAVWTPQWPDDATVGAAMALRQSCEWQLNVDRVRFLDAQQWRAAMRTEALRRVGRARGRLIDAIAAGAHHDHLILALDVLEVGFETIFGEPAPADLVPDLAEAA